MAQETGKVLRWLKAEGDDVAKGEPLMEVETDKVTVEVEAPADGRLAALRAGEGAEVPVGEAIAVIVAPGEDVPTTSEGIGAVLVFRGLAAGRSGAGCGPGAAHRAPTPPRLAEGTPAGRRARHRPRRARWRQWTARRGRRGRHPRREPGPGISGR